MMKLDLAWTPPGPVAAAFMASRARVQGINGPVGSGKTTAALMKSILLAGAQAPSTTDRRTLGRGDVRPVRKVRCTVVRDTYRQLWGTTMQSWFRRIPRDVGTFTGGTNGPATHQILMPMSDGTVAEMLVDFLAIGEHAVEDVLRGYEPTWFYLNELDLMVKEVLVYARGRTGRYPGMDEGGPSWHGVLFDCNAPELESWLYEDMFLPSPEQLARDGMELFRQPSGRSPKAENVSNLPPGYYDEQAKGQPTWYIKRFVENEPGYSRAGKPVYEEFSDALHVAGHELRYDPNLPLLIGLDAGLNPAAVIGQRLPSGQWQILAELVGETGTGARRFGQALGRLLREQFPGAFMIQAWADPSAAYGADKVAGEDTWIEIVAHEAQIAIRAAPTNALTPRLEAVRAPLTRLIDGQPGLLLSPRCKAVRLGFNSGYRYRKRLGASNVFDDTPEKNASSHPHDATQYLLLGGGEFQELAGRRERRERAARQMAPAEPFNALDYAGPT